MRLAPQGQVGLALGAWGAVQASAAGVAIAFGGALRDGVGGLALDGALGTALGGPATGYTFVYLVEILLLFATMAAIGPLVRPVPQEGGDAAPSARSTPAALGDLAGSPS
jgi:BCD family chlorophyll transporter-like MFS transporter